jgi:hypothetical protein
VDDAKTLISAHQAATRLRNVMARMRMRAARSAQPDRRDDLHEAFDEEQELAERQLQELLRLAGARAASA